jgi:cytochrome b6-f complex iron-sulfur subunit
MSSANAKLVNTRLSRRNFLSIAWVASTVILGGEAAGVILKYLQPVNTGGFGGVVNAGKVDDFQRGSITHNQAGRFFLIRNQEGSFLALWQKCTHLGCSVPWAEEENQFHCPCHGSLFNQNGEVLGGPAPRPLDYFPVAIKNGEVLVDTSSPTNRSKFDPSQMTKA